MRRWLEAATANPIEQGLKLYLAADNGTLTTEPQRLIQ